jgi:hypothetical protein
MAGLTFVKRSTLPAPIRGKVGTLSVAITSNGQIVLSALANTAIGNVGKVVMAFDGAMAYIFPETAKLVSKVAENDKIHLNKAKKGGTTSFSGAAILRAAKDFGASHVYDFKASGGQSFAVAHDEKNGCLKFELPEKLAARPVVKRTPKPKVSAVNANPGSIQGDAVLDEPELVLETA